MNQTSSTYLSNRVLKLNVGFLLASGAGHSHNSELDFPRVRVADDLTLEHISGPLRLSRTKEGVLVQAELEVAVSDECYRCLEQTEHTAQLALEELYAHHPTVNDAEFYIGEDAILDLGPLLRAETLIELSNGVLCQPDCRGICPECGINLNHETCDCDQDKIDPRMAVLKNLLDSE